MSTCGASMEPAARFQRPNGEYVIVHRCLDCGFELGQASLYLKASSF